MLLGPEFPVLDTEDLKDPREVDFDFIAIGFFLDIAHFCEQSCSYKLYQ